MVGLKDARCEKLGWHWIGRQKIFWVKQFWVFIVTAVGNSIGGCSLAPSGSVRWQENTYRFEFSFFFSELSSRQFMSSRANKLFERLKRYSSFL